MYYGIFIIEIPVYNVASRQDLEVLIFKWNTLYKLGSHRPLFLVLQFSGVLLFCYFWGQFLGAHSA